MAHARAPNVTTHCGQPGFTLIGEPMHSKNPWEFNYSRKEYEALELYDAWTRGVELQTPAPDEALSSFESLRAAGDTGYMCEAGLVTGHVPAADHLELGELLAVLDVILVAFGPPLRLHAVEHAHQDLLRRGQPRLPAAARERCVLGRRRQSRRGMTHANRAPTA